MKTFTSVCRFAVASFTLGVSARLCSAEAEVPKENPLHLSAAKRDAAGIVLMVPQTVTLAPEVEAFGRVLDPTPYVTLVAEVATARAALAASEKEFERAKKLFAGGGNASAQAVESAEATAARDRAALASADIRLLAGWGRTLAEHADLDALHATLVKGAALIRLDLLPGETSVAAPKTARVSLLGSEEILEVQILGPAPVADAQVQGASFLALLRGHSLPAGASLRAKLAGPGEPTQALVVPRSAIVYHEGSAWIYVLGANDTFERRLVTLGRSVGTGVVIADGIEATAQVVTTGAQQLLSAELQAGGGGGEG